MAITRCGDWLQNDSRFKSWGKTILQDSDLDLAKDRGYALNGSWVKWDDAVSLGENQFLVVAAETGSRNRHGYEYRLIEGGSTCRRVPGNEMRAVIDGALDAGHIVEANVANAKNSPLYRYALYCHLRYSGFAPAAPAARDSAVIEAEIKACEEKLEQLRAELLALTATETPQGSN